MNRTARLLPLPSLALGFLLACGGGGGGGTTAAATKTVADTFTYTNPSSGTYQLVQDTAQSTAGHLVLDLVGPAGSVSGVGFHLTTDATKVTWGSAPSPATFSNTLQASKVSGGALQTGIYQQGTTAAATVTAATVLARVALDLNSGVLIANADPIALTAGKALVLNPPASATPTTAITIAVGSLTAH